MARWASPLAACDVALCTMLRRVDLEHANLVTGSRAQPAQRSYDLGELQDNHRHDMDVDAKQPQSH